MYKMLPKQAISKEDFICIYFTFFLVYNRRISTYVFVVKPFLRNKELLFLAPHFHHLLPVNFSAFHTFSNLRSLLSPDLWVGGVFWPEYYHSDLLPDGLAQGLDSPKRNKTSPSCIRRGAIVLFAPRQKDERWPMTKQTSPPMSCLQRGEHPHSAAHRGILG